jgi:hypothetical protein
LGYFQGGKQEESDGAWASIGETRLGGWLRPMPEPEGPTGVSGYLSDGGCFWAEVEPGSDGICSMKSGAMRALKDCEAGGQGRATGLGTRGKIL